MKKGSEGPRKTKKVIRPYEAEEGGEKPGELDTTGAETGGMRLVRRLNEVLFDDVELEIFPLEIVAGVRAGAGNAAKTIADDMRGTIRKLIREYDIDRVDETDEGRIVVHMSCRDAADGLVESLHTSGVPFELEYGRFISHPGTLFVKGITARLATKDSVFSFFNERSKYKSLSEVSVIRNKYGQTFAILKFANYLDCDLLLADLPPTPNPFNEKSNTPLYLNKYSNRRQRSIKNASKDNTSSEASTYTGEMNHIIDSVFVDNLQEFFGSSVIDLVAFENFIKKFTLFGTLDYIYFPIKRISKDKQITLDDFGYVSFKSHDGTTKNTLECIYYLDNLSYEEFMDIDAKYDIKNDLNKDGDHSPKSNGIRISLNQHKFNHFLHNVSHPRFLIAGTPPLSIHHLDTNYHTFILTKFSRSINYQKTNLYVNNFPVLFSNDDSAWESFWSQFGKIKSAKIIKPEFYNKDSASHFGKIGFVFYESTKMTIRAILLTNDKVINFNNHATVIQSSFAIQKYSQIEQNAPARHKETPNSLAFQSPPPQLMSPEVFMYPIPLGYYNYFPPYQSSIAPDYSDHEQPPFNDPDVNS